MSAPTLAPIHTDYEDILGDALIGALGYGITVTGCDVTCIDCGALLYTALHGAPVTHAVIDTVDEELTDHDCDRPEADWLPQAWFL